MKVTFVIPPVLDGTHDVDRTSGCNYNIYFLPLLPMLYPATILKNLRHEVAIVDFAAQKKTPNQFREFVAKDDSDVYVFYTVFLCQKTDLIARDIIRTLRRNAYCVFTGPQPTYAPQVYLDKNDTFVARGEPEFVIRDLVQALISGQRVDTVLGLSFHDGKNPVHNPVSPFIPDLDQLPIPDRTLLDHTPYYNPKLHATPHTAAMASRGCFGRCWFCVPTSLDYARELEHKKGCGKKPPPRIHSAQRVIDEFHAIAALGFRSVSLLDDEFLWDDARTLKICEGIKDLKLEWSALCRPDKINDRVARAMKEAGCAYVDLGTESFDNEVLKAMKKDMTAEDTDRAVEVLRNAGIQVELNVLFGATPVETEDTIKKTLAHLHKLQVDYVLFSIANPFPGTEFYDAAKKEGWMCYGDYIPVDPAKQSIIAYPHLSKKKLEYYVTYAYLSYYFHPRYLFRQLLRVKGPRDFMQKVSTAGKFLVKSFLIH
ncbi:MAG: B12-binding domain-containing radical SAM protein [Candidatus Omnitrophica bacterium]|nr:B12-binding domain-containing radical SAM protein [Candidatus Omnitrophota bacterium]